MERTGHPLPMKGAGEDKVVVGGELVEAVVLECAVVDEPAGFVDDDESKDSPGKRVRQ